VKTHPPNSHHANLYKFATSAPAPNKAPIATAPVIIGAAFVLVPVAEVLAELALLLKLLLKLLTLELKLEAKLLEALLALDPVPVIDVAPAEASEEIEDATDDAAEEMELKTEVASEAILVATEAGTPVAVDRAPESSEVIVSTTP